MSRASWMSPRSAIMPVRSMALTPKRSVRRGQPASHPGGGALGGSLSVLVGDVEQASKPDARRPDETWKSGLKVLDQRREIGEGQVVRDLVGVLRIALGHDSDVPGQEVGIRPDETRLRALGVAVHSHRQKYACRYNEKREETSRFIKQDAL